MLLKMSISSGVLIILIIILRSLALNRLPKKSLYYCGILHY